MTPIHVIGDAETVLAFAVGGVSGHVVSRADEARSVFETLGDAMHDGGGPSRQPVLVFVTQGTARLIRSFLDQLILDATGPLVVEIPGVGETLGEARAEWLVERVLGVHL
jgi:vacuolar-type H+-ATPase subunit F/Vma7